MTRLRRKSIRLHTLEVLTREEWDEEDEGRMKGEKMTHRKEGGGRTREREKVA